MPNFQNIVFSILKKKFIFCKFFQRILTIMLGIQAATNLKIKNIDHRINFRKL